MSFRHDFDATVLREYDIRGIVGKTLHAADARAIGRCFGSIIRRDGGRTVAVGYDGRLSSPEMEAALTEGLQNGMAPVALGAIEAHIDREFALSQPGRGPELDGGGDGGPRLAGLHEGAPHPRSAADHRIGQGDAGGVLRA